MHLTYSTLLKRDTSSESLELVLNLCLPVRSVVLNKEPRGETAEESLYKGQEQITGHRLSISTAEDCPAMRRFD